MFEETVPTLLRCLKATKEREAKAPRTRVPSLRDQEIFRRVAVGGERQGAIAAELKLTKGRLSQIVSRVRRWIAEGSPGDPELLTWRQQQRLERSLAMRRQQEIFDKSMREADRQQACRQQSTVRTEVKEGEEPKVVTTVRDAPLNVQLLKTAQRAAEELERLSQREPLPEEPAKMPSEIELHEQVTYALRELRRQAEEAGRVTPGTASNITLISHVLDALLGEATYGLSHDPAAREIAERLLTGAAPIRPATLARCASEGTAGSCADCPAAAEQPERNADKPPADEKSADAAPTSPAAVAVTSPLETSSSDAANPAAEVASSQAAETAEKKPESIAVTRGGSRVDCSPRRRFGHIRHDRRPDHRQDGQSRRMAAQDSRPGIEPTTAAFPGSF